MKILKPGDPCPCCGNPIPETITVEDLLLLSGIAEGLTAAASVRSIDRLAVLAEADSEGRVKVTPRTPSRLGTIELYEDPQ